MEKNCRTCELGGGKYNCRKTSCSLGSEWRQSKNKIKFNKNDFETVLNECFTTISDMKAENLLPDIDKSIVETIKKAIDKGYIEKSELDITREKYLRWLDYNSGRNISIKEPNNFIAELGKEIKKLTKIISNKE